MSFSFGPFQIPGVAILLRPSHPRSPSYARDAMLRRKISSWFTTGPRCEGCAFTTPLRHPAPVRGRRRRCRLLLLSESPKSGPNKALPFPGSVLGTYTPFRTPAMLQHRLPYTESALPVYSRSFLTYSAPSLGLPYLPPTPLWPRSPILRSRTSGALFRGLARTYVRIDCQHHDLKLF